MIGIPPPPPPGTPLIPPVVLTAPRLRYWLQRWLTWIDRRKAAKLWAQGRDVIDVQWKARYTDWWENELGWSTGSPPPDEALRQMRAWRAGR